MYALRNSACFKFLTLMICAVQVFAVSPALAQATDDYEVRTVNDPKIPKDELEIIVKPLTKEELALEADAWLELVKTKVREVSRTEVAIKRKNKQIEAANETAAAVEKAQQAAEKAATSGDAESAEKAEKEAQAAAQKLVEATERTDDDSEVKEAVEEANQRAKEEQAAEHEEAGEAVPEPQDTGGAVDEGVNEAAAIAQSGISTDSEATENAAESVKRAAEGSTEEKTNLLDTVTKLREERIELVDRTRVVLAELDKKGGDSQNYRDYLVAVSGVSVDVTDRAALWATIEGWFTSPQGGLRWGWNFVRFFGVLFVFYLFSVIAGRIADRALRTKRTKKLTNLMREFLAKSIRRTIILIGFVMAMSQLEINTAPLLTAIGAAGFVIAFALQDSLSNFASGIMILMYRPFDVGDVVETGGAAGKVISLNLVSVTISTFDNKTVVVPNNKVWNDVITNATGVKTRRVDMVFGIGYNDDIKKTQEVLERIVLNHPLVLKDPEPVIKLHELADSSINFICRPWSKTDDYWDVWWDVTRSVKEEFDKEGISIPYPQQDVHMHMTNAADAPTPFPK